MRRLGKSVATFWIAIISSFSYSTVLQASDLFSEELLKSVIGNAAKEIVKQSQPNTSQAPKVVQQPKAKVKQYRRPQKEQRLWVRYKDWVASSDTLLSGGGDWVTECRIHTGGDGDSTISVSQMWGEPEPSIVFSEATARGYPTQLQGQQEVSWKVLVGNKAYNFAGTTDTGVSESGIPYAENTVNSTYQGGETNRILTAFARGSKVLLMDEYSGGDLYTGSLSGFTAAYRKMSEWCGFSVDKVL